MSRDSVFHFEDLGLGVRVRLPPLTIHRLRYGVFCGKAIVRNRPRDLTKE